MLHVRYGVLFALLMSCCSAGMAAERGIIINEDNSHFFTSRTAEEMTLEGLHRFVDQYAGTEVSHLFLNPNAMRASFKSRTRDTIWELNGQAMPEGVGKRWMDNARLLHERGLDPYAVWIARCREKGIVPWISMRMNDVHDVPDETSYMHSTFWRQHPEYRRVPESQGGWTECALNYALPEVREHAMSFLRELFERYDPDGVELDWMRFGWHFKPGEEAQGAEILTAFMVEVRSLAKQWSEKRGHPILMGARVPADPDAAAGLGMDGVRWAREGLVDMLVPTPFWTSSDFDIPVEVWKARIGSTATPVVIAPGLEYNVRAWPGGAAVANTLESTRGFAAAGWHRGADQIYLFNYMDSETIPVSGSDYRILLEQGLGPEVVNALPRRHIQAFRDTVPSGVPNGVVLPAECRPGVSFRLNIGPKPADGQIIFVAGLAQRDGADSAKFEVTVNGQPCSAQADLADVATIPGAVRAVQFACPLGAVQHGYNEVVLTQTDDGAVQQCLWAEIRVVPAAPVAAAP
ncbi:MAG: hypothetical protein HYV27_20695 [Candidatus Hydrogenedentes bacterium]|nr:hypothetical protein [Candidatus Hydrogenedentota bacterium]